MTTPQKAFLSLFVEVEVKHLSYITTKKMGGKESSTYHPFAQLGKKKKKVEREKEKPALLVYKTSSGPGAGEPGGQPPAKREPQRPEKEPLAAALADRRLAFPSRPGQLSAAGGPLPLPLPGPGGRLQRRGAAGCPRGWGRGGRPAPSAALMRSRPGGSVLLGTCARCGVASVFPNKSERWQRLPVDFFA